jgi:hypothetical protein
MLYAAMKAIFPLLPFRPSAPHGIFLKQRFDRCPPGRHLIEGDGLLILRPFGRGQCPFLMLALAEIRRPEKTDDFRCRRAGP